MTADEIAASLRSALGGAGELREVRMFGGIGFMLNGNMIAAASGRGLLVRVGRDGQRHALSRPGVAPMVMRGRIMDGYVHVDPPDVSDETVEALLSTALPFVRELPAKAAGEKPGRRR